MTHVFLLAGQSNMVGCGVAGELTPELRTPPTRVRLFEDGEFVTFASGPTFGPELGFAHDLGRSRGEPIVLCKVARSGANLYYDWNPDGVSSGPQDAYRGPLYPQMVSQVGALWQRLSGAGAHARVCGMLWLQGERDSVFDFMAAVYQRRLSEFIRCVRRDLGSTDMPFIMALIAPRRLALDTGQHFPHAYRDTVRAAQRRVARSVPRVGLVETDDLPQSDNLHFDTAGQIELGRRYARVYEQIGPAT